jgi:hypothetical protein
MKPLSTLTEAQAQLLREQVIDDTHPGTILRDFQAVLDYVGPQGVKSAGKYNLLPIETLTDLDQRLTRPLRLKLKRPQVRSHPYLLGLNLLLRATGLGRVEGTGAKSRLGLASEVLASWNTLNPTERYFTLLEAWLRVSTPEMVGERERRGGGALLECLGVWHHTPAAGKMFDLSHPQDVYLFPLGRAFYHLALLDLFGLMEVEHPRTPVQPWCPAGLKHLPFGDAVFSLLGEKFAFTWRGADDEDEEAPGDVTFGRWQPIFQPYFPEWRNNLVVPGVEARGGIFVFRAALGKARRLIAIPARLTLDDLAGAILDSVDFDDDHLYEFTYRDRFGAEMTVTHPYCEDPPFTSDVTVGEVPLSPGQSMTFLFDFGDNWRFDVRLERIDPPDKKLKAPRVLESHGKAPQQYPNWEEE